MDHSRRIAVTSRRLAVATRRLTVTSRRLAEASRRMALALAAFAASTAPTDGPVPAAGYAANAAAAVAYAVDDPDPAAAVVDGDDPAAADSVNNAPPTPLPLIPSTTSPADTVAADPVKTKKSEKYLH